MKGAKKYDKEENNFFTVHDNIIYLIVITTFSKIVVLSWKRLFPEIVDHVVGMAQSAHPNVPIFMLGHSAGGVIAFTPSGIRKN